MTKQESTYNPITYNLIEFKEFDDDILVIHEKYDEDGFHIYKLRNNILTKYIKADNQNINYNDVVLFERVLPSGLDYKVLCIFIAESTPNRFLIKRMDGGHIIAGKNEMTKKYCLNSISIQKR